MDEIKEALNKESKDNVDNMDNYSVSFEKISNGWLMLETWNEKVKGKDYNEYKSKKVYFEDDPRPKVISTIKGT